MPIVIMVSFVKDGKLRGKKAITADTDSMITDMAQLFDVGAPILYELNLKPSEVKFSIFSGDSVALLEQSLLENEEVTNEDNVDDDSVNDSDSGDGSAAPDEGVELANE